MRCAKHPNEETFVRCGRCETPVCGRCSVMAPTGVRCKDCANLRWSPIYRMGPAETARACAAGAGAALALGWLPVVNILIFLGGAIYGYAIGEAVTRAGGRRQGRVIEAIAAASVLLGALFWLFAPVPLQTASRALIHAALSGRLSEAFLTDLAILVFNLGLATVIAVSRIRSV